MSSSRDETLGQRTTIKCFPVAAPTHSHTACMLLMGGYMHSSQLSTLHCKWRRGGELTICIPSKPVLEEQWLLALKKLKSEPWRLHLNTRQTLGTCKPSFGKAPSLVRVSAFGFMHQGHLSNISRNSFQLVFYRERLSRFCSPRKGQRHISPHHLWLN